MLYSVDWLRRLCPTEESDACLAEALTARGLTVDCVTETPQGGVLDIDIPANRPDCLGHLGVARELVAALGATLVQSPPEPALHGSTAWLSVEIEAPDLCSRYTAGLVRNVRVGPSPDWVVRRLECCGLRPINNVVDVSNLVLLELGQPIHFFDHARLDAGDAGQPLICVRRARSGERLETLDGIDRKLEPEMLVIADARRSVALAGVIGGRDTEIGDTTRDVLIEAAHFDPRAVRSTSRRLALQTDASFRFERGVDPARLPAAQALAARLLVELAAGEIEEGILDAYPTPREPRSLGLRLSEIDRLLGYRPDADTVSGALRAIGLSPAADGEDRLMVRIPTWRSDLDREADLVEEVARHLGYDQIPTRVPAMVAARETDPLLAAEDRARDMVAAHGFHEAIGYAMIAHGEDDRFLPVGEGSPLALSNPIAEPLSVLRRSILPGLLRAADRNHRHGARDVRLFETGRVFLPGGEGERPTEPTRLALAWSGLASPGHWATVDRAVDLHDLAGLVELLCAALSPGWVAAREAGGPSALHPGRSIRWTDSARRVLAWAGELHPELQACYEQPILVAEIELDAVLADPPGIAQFRELPRFPSVSRDLSLILPRELSYERLLEALRTVDPPAPVFFQPIDRYEGAPLDETELSLTVRLTLHPAERTLTHDETESYRQALVARLERDVGARIRG